MSVEHSDDPRQRLRDGGCLIQQPPGWRCTRDRHSVNSPCALVPIFPPDEQRPATVIDRMDPILAEARQRCTNGCRNTNIGGNPATCGRCEGAARFARDMIDRYAPKPILRMPARTHTYTFAILDVSPGTYQEIRRKLDAADYQQAFHDDGGREVIDMQGIALAEKP